MFPANSIANKPLSPTQKQIRGDEVESEVARKAKTGFDSRRQSAWKAMRSASIYSLLVTLALAILGQFEAKLAAQEPAPNEHAKLDQVEYEFKYHPGPAIQVQLKFQAGDSMKTQVRCAKEWGGIVTDGSFVSQIAAKDSAGKELAIRKLAPYAWEVEHSPNASIQVDYTIPATGERPRVPGNDYRTFLDESRFQCIGNLAILMPAIWPDAEKGEKKSDEPKEDFEIVGSIESRNEVDFTIRFVDFEKAEWSIASSFGNGAGPFSFRGRPGKFMQSVILAGKIQTVQRTIRNQPIMVAVVGTEWKFHPDQLADVVAKIVETERDFFDDHSDPWFLVTLSPIKVDSPQAFSLGGTALTNAFALFCSNNLNVSPEDPRSQEAYSLLSHEYFHNWNGIKIPTAGDDPGTYWFSEGFTNYYTRRMLVRAGYANDESYAQALSRALRNYDSNPMKAERNERIQEEFWSNRQVQELPYQRGDMLAVVIDQHIRTKTNGEKSLDDFMRELFRKPLDPNKVDSEVLFERLKSWVEPEMLRHIERVVRDGAAVELPSHLVEPNLKLVSGEMREFDPNIDIEKTRKEKKLAGIVEGSEAYKAGLRNGQQLVKFNVDSGDGSKAPIADVEVMIDGKKEKIQFEAIGPPKKVRQYVVK